MDRDEVVVNDWDLSRLDCNENGIHFRRLRQRQQLHASKPELSPRLGVLMDIQGRPSDGGQPGSDPQSPSMTGLAFSPEDTLNNDFFYDEEFTIPFDANLTEDFHRRTKDTDEIPNLLPDGDDNDGHWKCLKMAVSKSDSCIYQPEFELSESEQMSVSDRDYVSSSEISDIQNHPLFSSHSEQVDLNDGVSDSLVQSGMSGSMTQDTPKYDWTINKQQYMISFDRSPTKMWSSGDELGHLAAMGATPKLKTRVTSWDKTVQNKKKSKIPLYVSKNSEKKSVHGSMEKKKNEVHTAKNLEVKAGAPLVTWGQMKDVKKPNDSAASGLTTWKCIQSTKKTIEVRDGQTGENCSIVSKPSSCSISQSKSKSESKDDEKGSGTLLKLYQQLKSCSDINTFQSNEAMVSPNAMEKCSVNWSISSALASSPYQPDHQAFLFSDRLPVASNSNPSILSNAAAAAVAKRRPQIQMGSILKIDNFSAQETTCSKDVSASTKRRAVNSSEQVGSALTNAERFVDRSTTDQSVQFPPVSVDSAVQTSIHLSPDSPCAMESKSLQTSVLNRTSMDCERKQGGVRESMMSHSSYLLTKPLPDLSFLKKGLSSVPDLQSKSSISNLVSLSNHDCSKKDSSNTESVGMRGSRKSMLRCHSADVKAASSSSDSYDSPAHPVTYRLRSRSSDSNFSVCSTSSSGIDPGICDSARQSSSSSTIGHGSQTDIRRTRSEYSKIPPKPPRLFTTGNECCRQRPSLEHKGELLYAGEQMSKPVISVCNICNLRSVFASKEDFTKALALSHPMYLRHEAGEFSRVGYLQVSPTHAKPRNIIEDDRIAAKKPCSNAEVSSPVSPRHQVRRKDGVTLRTGLQTAKPAKSILVRHRQRNQAKHRSWSNPVDDANLKIGFNRVVIASNPRPFSLPDVNLLQSEQSSMADCKSASDRCLHEHDSTMVEPEGGERYQPTSEDSVDRSYRKDSDVDAEDQDYERFKAKKSVSFSEKIFYHPTSAATSPMESPKCPQNSLPCAAEPETSESVQQTEVEQNKCEALNDDLEMPPTDFMVSPNLSPSSSLSNSETSSSFDLQQKRELVLDVMKAVEVLLKYFSQTRDAAVKAKLGSTIEHPEIGRLVLEHLCPAIHAIILDGLKPDVRSLFGKVKNSPCKVVEDSVDMGQPVELIQRLVKSVKTLKCLQTPWLLFNGYIFALLNYKVLDFWLTFIHNHRPLLARHYNSSSFLQMSSSSSGHLLFLDMITSLQPLAQIPFRLEYNFESRLLEHRRQEQLAEYLLDHHVSRSAEAHIEGQLFLTQMENLNLSSSQQLTRGGDRRSLQHPSEVGQRTKDFFFSTQHRLSQKLSLSKEKLTTEGASLMKNVAKAATTTRRSRPVSLPNNPQLKNLIAMSSSECEQVIMGVQQLPASTDDERGNHLQSGSRLLSSDSSTSEGGFFARLTKQIKGTLSDKVYKRGATDYSFDSESDKIDEDSSEEKSLSLKDELQDSGSSKKIDPSRLEDKCVANEKDPVQVNAKFDSSMDVSLNKPSCNTDSTKLAGSSSLPNQCPNGKGVHVQLSSVASSQDVTKKRWSGFGSRLVNIFDKLLLGDSVSSLKSPERLPTMAFVKCPSEGQINQLNATMLVKPANGDHRSALQLRSVSMDGDRLLNRERFQSTRSLDGEQVHMRGARTLCHYVATDSRQLSFEKGSCLIVLREDDSDWFVCRHAGQEGLVHKACVNILDFPDSFHCK